MLHCLSGTCRLSICRLIVINVLETTKHADVHPILAFIIQDYIYVTLSMLTIILCWSLLYETFQGLQQPSPCSNTLMGYCHLINLLKFISEVVPGQTLLKDCVCYCFLKINISNISGIKGKQQLCPTTMEYIKAMCFIYWPLKPYKKCSKEWMSCVRAMENSNRCLNRASELLRFGLH